MLERLRILLFAGLLIIGGTISAQTDTTRRVEVNGVEYILHVVEKGNTLYSLSREYQVSVDDIVKVNPSAASGLSLGETLKIPVPNKREELKRKIELDGNYLAHEVTEKQTLYAISKMYNVEIKDIVAENQNAIYGIKEGDLLKIPIAKIKKPTVGAKDVTKDKYPDHVVKPKETLYSISRQYDVSISEIEKLNGGLIEGLIEGQIINIPLNIDDNRSIAPGKEDSLILKNHYNIVLFLPLYLTINDSLDNLQTGEGANEIYGGTNTAAALKFYQGIVMALDSLGRKGFKATLHVIDTENNEEKIKKYINDPNFKNVDLIIGPLYPENFKMVLEAAELNNIRIVSPINPSNRMLLGNTQLIKVVTSKTTQVIDLSKYIANNYRKQNIVVLKKDFVDNSLADAFINNYTENLKLIDDSLPSSPAREYSCNASTSEAHLRTLLIKDTINIVFLPSSDKVFVSDIVKKLNSLSSDYKITLVGLEEWLKFDNIDLDYFSHLNLHVITWNNLDYENKLTLNFVNKYYQRFESFPGEFGSNGYDIGIYMFTLMHKYGNSFLHFIERNPMNLSGHSFHFCQTGMESGYENQSLVILKFSDYQLTRVH